MNSKLTAILFTGMLVMGLSSSTVAQSTEGALSDDPVLADLYDKLVADGSWIVTGHRGEGMVIDVTVDGLFVLYWMTYDKQGGQMWLVGVTEQSSEAEVQLSMYQYSGPVFGPEFNTDDLEAELWGELHINFRDCAFADVHYDSVTGYGTGQLEIQRIYYAAGSLCQPE